MSTHIPRKPSVRTALFAVAGIGALVTVTATMSAWTDTATVTGDIESGTFNLTLNGAETATLGTAGQVLNAGDSAVGDYDLANDSSVAADVTLGVAGFTGANAGVWTLDVTAGGESVYSGDPALAPAALTIPGVGGAELTAGEIVPIDVTLTLTDQVDAPATALSVAPVLTFTSTQV